MSALVDLPDTVLDRVAALIVLAAETDQGIRVVAGGSRTDQDRGFDEAPVRKGTA